ncbi:hypothetical protein CDD83_8552 [Cordyceps sp. RAO-2017]|nr:hypothetical protein CDD83_8552 [Cordyceps sp. RAO-2017]
MSTALPAHMANSDYRNSVINRRRTFKPVDWPAYKENCDKNRFSESSSDTYEVPLSELDLESEPYGLAEGLRRMFTVVAFRDASWIAAILFVIGSTAFVVSAFFQLLPLAIPESAFPGEVELAFPLTIAFGAANFFSGGTLSLIGAFNDGRGPLPENKLGQPISTKYHPALLGSKEWVWFPTFAELRSVYLPNPAFRGGLVSMLGGLVLTSAAVMGFPGVLDPEAPDFPAKVKNFIFTPLFIGGSFLSIGALMLTILAQERWYKLAPSSVTWQASFWNVAAAGLLVVSIGIVLLDDTQMLASAAINMVSSWLFLLAALLQWYLIMEWLPS